jgi:HAD superfamily hydrolase (TIGR01509 family)
MFGKKLPAAVLWDMDGTLVDSEHHWLASEKALAEAHNAQWTEQDGHDLIGNSLYESSKIIKTKIGSDMDTEAIVQHLTDSVVARLSESIVWRPGAQELLRELKRKKIKTALVTMSLHRMAEEVVSKIPFDAFDVIVGGDDVVRGKPFADPYLKAAELLGVDPTECVAFEDSNTGLRSAEAAGTKAVGIPNFIEIPMIPGRILWPTLQGVRLKDLQKLFS